MFKVINKNNRLNADCDSFVQRLRQRHQNDTQLTFTCSKLTKETLQKGVVLVTLLLNIFHTYFTLC